VTARRTWAKTQIWVEDHAWTLAFWVAFGFIILAAWIQR
jgi:hypothetical protein